MYLPTCAKDVLIVTITAGFVIRLSHCFEHAGFGDSDAGRSMNVYAIYGMWKSDMIL